MSIGILLAVMAAVGYGAADFVGGLASRRVSHWTVAIAGQLAGGAALLVAGLSLPGCSTAASPVLGSAASSSRSPKSPSRPACCRWPPTRVSAPSSRWSSPARCTNGCCLARDPRGARRQGAAGGLLGTSGTVAFLLATRTTHIAVTGVLASLYPAVTVLLAAVLLRERVRPGQTLGLAGCGASVCLVALG
jgi:EamA-like transporter family